MTAPETPRALLHRLARQARALLQAERDAGILDVHGTPAPPVRAPHGEEGGRAHGAPTNVRRDGPPDRPGPSGRAPAAPEAPRASRPASESRASSGDASHGRSHGAPSRAPTPRTAAPFTPKVRPLDLPADVLAPFDDLPARVAACAACRLCEERTFTVFGEGSPSARLVFCGEGPGFEEDRSGRPFVGRAGELLTRMIEGGLRVRREDVFILNAVKCRPPNNRTPQPDEVAACRPFLEEQLRVIGPAVIVTLGNPGTQAVLGDVGGITRVRGQVFEAYGARVVPTFHPAYLLRNPAAKREAWDDLQLVMRLLAAPGDGGPGDAAGAPA